MESVNAIHHWWEVYRDEGLKSTCSEIRRVVRSDYYYPLLNYCGLEMIDSVYRDEYFSTLREDPWRTDAKRVSTALDDEFEPDSVLDIGCGIGLHLEYFNDNDVDVKGVDGASRAKKHSVIPEDRFELHDLRNPFYPEREYDLAISFETAEHIPQRFSDTLVDSIVRGSECIAFTAAVPGQYGHHHVNLQPHEFWIEKFRERGFTYREDTTNRVKAEMDDLDKTDWIPHNLLIFTSGG